MIDEHSTRGNSGRPDDFERQLLARLYRWDCPGPEELSDFFLGSLPDKQCAAIDAHLEQCLLCRQEINYLRKFLALDGPLQQFSGKEVGPVLYVARRLFAPERMIQPAVRGDEMPLQELRFIGEGQDAEELRLFLGVGKKRDYYLLEAQFVASNEAKDLVNAVVELWQEGSLLDTTTVDELGTFSFQLKRLSSIMLRITTPSGSMLVSRVTF